MTSNRNMPAEWQRDCAVLLSWPHAQTDWEPMLDEVCACYRQMIKAFVSEDIPVVIFAPKGVSDSEPEISGKGIRWVEMPTNDTWIRDYGPITVERTEGSPLLLDFRFNGWGLKFAADKDNLVNSRAAKSGLFSAPLENRLGFVLEGGSIDSDGAGSVLTTSRCLLSANRNGGMDRQQIEQYLKENLGLSRVLWLESGALEGDDTDSHIDTLARFAPHDTIVFTGCYDQADSHYTELSAMKEEIESLRTLDGRTYSTIELPLPSPVFDKEGNRLPATYSNFLVTPTAIFMPSYNQPMNDNLASGMLEAAYGLPVKTIDCTALIRQHGSLHCATMQVPLTAMSNI